MRDRIVGRSAAVALTVPEDRVSAIGPFPAGLQIERLVISVIMEGVAGGQTLTIAAAVCGSDSRTNANLLTGSTIVNEADVLADGMPIWQLVNPTATPLFVEHEFPIGYTPESGPVWLIVRTNATGAGNSIEVVMSGLARDIRVESRFVEAFRRLLS